MLTDPRHHPIAAPVVKLDGLGCALDSLTVSQQLDAGALRVHRKHAQQDVAMQVEMPAADRGFLLGCSLRAGHRRRVLRGNHATTHAFAEDTIYLRDFSDSYRADLSGSFDFMLVEFSHDWLARLGTDVTRRPVSGLRSRTGCRDDILGHLMRAMLPAFASPDASQALFLEQVGMAVGCHLITQYGGSPAISRTRRVVLSARQEALAKELLTVAAPRTGVTIEAIAAQCQLSPSYFIRAFRGSTGQTPYQWQLAHRIEQAQQWLLDGSLRIVDVAGACGFSDQAHFTRVFSKVVGVSPGQWRRRHGTVPENRP